jgi:hypothetical protein
MEAARELSLSYSLKGFLQNTHIVRGAVTLKAKIVPERFFAIMPSFHFGRLQQLVDRLNAEALDQFRLVK